MQSIVNKSAKVIVADPSEACRMEAVSALRAAGFEQVSTCSSTSEVRRELTAGRADWIVASLMGNDPQNMLGVLRLIVSEENLVHVRVSLLVDTSETECLPAAFEMGLMSWHPKPFNKISLAGTVKELTSIAGSEAAGGNASLVAAEYLRRYLLSALKWRPLAALAESLVENFFGKPELLLHLAEAKLIGQKVEDGLATLRQARFFDRRLEASALALIDKYGYDDLEEESIGGPSKPKEVHFKTAVVVDHDEATGRSVKEMLQSLGVKVVDVFQDGMAAWEAIKARPEPDLLVHEWKIPGLNGPALLQRIRNHGYRNVPVIVMSSLVKPADGPLIAEMSVANVLSKPVLRDDFFKAIQWTSIQEKLPTDSKAIERKLMANLKAGKLSKATQMKAAMFASPQVSEGERRYIEAEFLYHRGDVLGAKQKAIESIKLIGKGSLAPLNLLGKCLLKLKDFNAAARILDQARSISPENIGRLLDLAELHLVNNQPQMALEMVASVRSLDPTLPQVASVEVRSAIAARQSKRACELMRDMESLSDIASYMNNRAVAFAHVGKFKEAVELYQSTLVAIPVDRTVVRATVAYNLGLCLCRADDWSSAIQILAGIPTSVETPISAKAVALASRIRKALDSGTKLRYTPESTSAGGVPEDYIAFESLSGEVVADDGIGCLTRPENTSVVCLAGIFKNPEAVSPFVQGLLKVA